MELLSPAGHWEAMAAAVQNGADAVYLGLGGFNARRGAKNFTDDEFAPAVEYCHQRGVKVYLTLNTLLTDRELPAAETLLREASRQGADGVIVQDWGLAALAREIVPDLPLHGSTQMTIHSLGGLEKAAEMGMQCVVLSRELSREDIRFICRRSPIKIEVFVHGALCMCYSGQCAMSALIGSRSGNRGLCAQPCRLPYRMDGGKASHLLSLKDANLSAHLRELRDMGVSILKLEGRMKRPEYVAVITHIYASLLKEDRLPSSEELEQLEQAFSRNGFTDAYWEGRPGPHMFGMRPQNAAEPKELFQKAKAAYDSGGLRTVPVTMAAEILENTPSCLTVSDLEGHTVQAFGPIPEPARTRPLAPEEVKARLSKTGNTVFRPQKTELRLDPGLSLTVSAINALRRDALEQLGILRNRRARRREEPAPALPSSDCAAQEPMFTASLTNCAQLTRGLADLSPAIIYIPVERLEDFDLDPFLGQDIEFCAALPRICKDSEAPFLLRCLEQAEKRGCTSVSIQNLGQLPLVEKLGLTIRGDFGLNVFNSFSLAELRHWGLQSATVSFELRHEQIRDLKKPLPCEAIVYGRLPLMITENCLTTNQPHSKPHSLTDRKGEAFPILPAYDHRSEIENSKFLFLADKPEYRHCGLTYARLRFTTETPEECAAILSRYRGYTTTSVENYTRGLFYRGVE